jgi:peptide chain release factor 1
MEGRGDLLSEGEAGGYKEIIATVSGKGVFARLKFESGVHRVQRVPETEAGGRIHTSAATVAVLPEAEDVDIEVRDRGYPHRHDARLGRRRPARQHDRFGRAHHPYPDRLVVPQSEKSQHQNRARAMQICARASTTWNARKPPTSAPSRAAVQVGSGDRSERIRTYNFPQGRVTDHRINLTLYKLDRMMMGEIDEVIDPLISDHQAGQLATLGDDGQS